MDKIAIELDRTRYLRFTFEAVALFDERNAVPLAQVINEGDVRFSTLLNMLWAGLTDDDPKVTRKQVSDLLEKYWFDSGKTLDELMKVINDGIEKSNKFSQGKKKTEAEQVSQTSTPNTAESH